MVQTFPGIPLVILRQSSLGGGLIDIFLGNGVLNVPASAEGAQALASTLIALHPFAVAGFFALVVNALALVPAGSKLICSDLGHLLTSNLLLIRIAFFLLNKRN